MPTSTGRRAGGHLTAAILLMTIAGGCAGRPVETTAESQAVTSTAAATTTTVAALTAEDRAWLDALPKLDAKVTKALSGRLDLTISKMRSLADAYRSCTRRLRRMGAPGDLLERVYALAKKACDAYDKGARCWDTAARIGYPLAGSAEQRKSDKAIDCGFDAQGAGTKALVEAMNEAEDVKARFG